ncbi:hypothetical protein Gohar_004842 [Gossypium harknessii]|uniref:Uncharacterized protein n=1 Tax=Gossypium harknessii TaxID=34285 RepID=A0A7J9H675_9ROSI|nr:hypothetical protein [Gossypium harknessii]
MLLVKPPFFTSSSWERLSPQFQPLTVEYKNISFTVWDVGGQDKVTSFSFYSNISPLTVKIKDCMKGKSGFVHCGGITSKTHKDSFLWLIAMIVIVWSKPGMSCTGC